jgi:dihydroneopterin aldolase
VDLAIRLDLSRAGDDGELVHTLHDAELVEQVKGLVEERAAAARSSDSGPW